MNAEAVVREVRVGRAVTQTWNGRTFITAACKQSVDGPILLTRNGFVGDEQGNRKVHGGPDKAVLLYNLDHYAAWRAEGFDVPDGGFFENLSITGVTESDVLLGDSWSLGDALVQITAPRRPCRTIADRWGDRRLPREVQRTGRTGFYVRVLREAPVAAGDALVLQDRLPGAVSAAEVNRVMNIDRRDLDGIHALLAAPELPQSWREKLQRRLTGELEDDTARLDG